MAGKAKDFFSEENKQKTFYLYAPGSADHAPGIQMRQARKVSWSFFTKKDCFLPSFLFSSQGMA